MSELRAVTTSSRRYPHIIGETRSAWLVCVLLVVVACERATPSAPVESVAAKPTKLRIPRVAPIVGAVRVESGLIRAPDGESRKVKRFTDLAIDGLAVMQRKVTYLEATGTYASLAGKSFVVSFSNGNIDIAPADGTPTGDTADARKDNKDVGRPYSTALMVSDRDFEVGTPTTVPTAAPFPPEVVTTLTLRSFDATTATFDVTLDQQTSTFEMHLNGSLSVDRATGAERGAAMTMDMTMGETTKRIVIETQTTIEAPR